MSCEGQSSSNESDKLEVKPSRNPLDESATAWLLGQAIRYLNTADKEGEFGYARTVEVLRRCSGDAVETAKSIFAQLRGGDTPLRWNVVHVLGDVGDGSAADLLMSAALKPLPEATDDGCEGAQDMELLVSTCAVHSLRRVAGRLPEVADALLRVIAERPARPVLIEAVKAADELGLREKAQALLPKEDQWILEIRRARAQEMFADPERQDGGERGFTPPKAGALYTAPGIVRCVKKGY